MQSSLSSLQKVTAALAAEQGPQLYVSDAARLGFPPGDAPRYLETDLGSGTTFWFVEFDSEGAALYRQLKGKPRRLSLRVLNARSASAEAALPASLLTELNRMVEQADAVRAGFVDQADKEDIAHLLQAMKFGLIDSLRFLYLGQHAGFALRDIAGASDRTEALRRSLERFDAWLESWTPETSASALTSLHHSIEFEAVKGIARLMRQAIATSK